MKSVVVIGPGGNIGSHLVAHLARHAAIRRITLVDRDEYDAANLRSQDIRRRDLRRPKATVQARRLREIDPSLDVVPMVASVEDVPLGALRADVWLACVDSRATRRAINALAWRLGVAWIDAGVNGDELLARINVYRPGPGEPCYECAWDDRDYATQEQAYPCAVHEAPPATNAPSALGALAASLQALECGKLLAGEWDRVAVGRQVTVSARGHREMVTTFRPNPRCRFDHEVWRIERVARPAEDMSVAQALELGRRALGAADVVGLKVVDQRFVGRLVCMGCGGSREFGPYLLGRLGSGGRTCDGCGGAMRVAGFDVVEWLRARELPPSVRRASLRSLGLRAGDVVSVDGGDGVAHFQMGDRA